MTDATTRPFPLAPYPSGSGTVRPEWIDSNDHMNLAYYIVLFDQGTDGIYAAFGMNPGYKARTNCGTFAAESHILYENELRLGDTVAVTSYVVAADAKRIHLAHEMHRTSDGVRAAMQEILLLHVDLATRRVAPWPADVLARLKAAEAAHAQLPRPTWLGRHVGQPRAR